MHGSPSTNAFSDNVALSRVSLSPGMEAETETEAVAPRRFLVNSAQDIHDILSNSDIKKVKALLRSQHWPVNHDVRRVLWLEISRRFLIESTNIYEETVLELYGQDDESAELTLPHFVDPAHQVNYFLNQEGVNTVMRILGVVSELHPDITYCPSLYAISSVLLHYMKECDVFCCITALMKHRHLTQTKKAHLASNLVFRDLAKKFAKSCYSFLQHNCKQMDHVFDNWMWWIFNHLPFSYVVKVMDCFLFEGPKILYRAALTILILFHKHQGKLGNSGNLTNAVSHFCENMPLSEEKFMKMAFSIRSFSRNEIKRLQLKNELELNSRDRVSAMTISASHENLSLKMSHSFNGTAIALQPCKSDLLSHKELQTIWSWLPRRLAIYQPTLLFSTEEHGTSILTLFSRTSGHGPTIIVIKNMENEVFGAFCGSDWSDRHQHGNFLTYFGTGETFLFTIYPNRRKYEWVGITNQDVSLTGQMFMAGDNTTLTIGGGNGEGLQLDSELFNGQTKHCDTFDNEPLCSQPYFKAKIVEVFGID